MRLHHLFLALSLAAATAACETVPVTGRSQLNLVDEDTEAKLGEQAFEEIKAKSKISRDPEANALVKRVATRIAKASGHEADWEVIVIDEPQVNAFALPGGKIAVYTGMLPVAKDEAGLATVMAHEVGHVIAHHGAERMSRSELISAGTSVLAGVLSGTTGTNAQATAAVLGAGATYGLELPFSRNQEYEADRIGLTLMAKAGYDPRAAVPFWQRMAQASKGGGPPEFMSTHPTDENRIKRLQDLMPEAMAHYRR
jgi:metalloendopeptidase OMA1, mitochondrial